MHVEPIYWGCDHSLRTYPLPDLIVCADKHDPFSVTQMDCTVTNPVSINDFPVLIFEAPILSILKHLIQVKEANLQAGVPEYYSLRIN